MDSPGRLEDVVAVYRTATRARDFGGGLPLPSLFFRAAKDTIGLSVDYNVEVPAGCGAQLSGKRAVVKLISGEVRSVDNRLDVVPDTPTHANITGLPFYEDFEQRELAEQLAAMLVEICDVAWTKESDASR